MWADCPDMARAPCYCSSGSCIVLHSYIKHLPNWVFSFVKIPPVNMEQRMFVYESICEIFSAGKLRTFHLNFRMLYLTWKNYSYSNRNFWRSLKKIWMKSVLRTRILLWTPSNALHRRLKSSVRKGKFVPVINQLNSSSLHHDNLRRSGGVAQDRGEWWSDSRPGPLISWTQSPVPVGWQYRWSPELVGTL